MEGIIFITENSSNDIFKRRDFIAPLSQVAPGTWCL